MKKYILLAIVGLLLMSCFEDKGNYSYTVGEQITVSGVEKEYLRYFMNDRLVVRPEVCSTDPDARFEYLWTISAQGRLGDTLTLDKVLDTLVNWEPNQNYTLVLAVTNMNSGYTVYQEAELIVGTPYSWGWYVLKDDGQQTDIDLYSEQGKLSNILFAVNGQNLKGKAQKLSFIASHQVFDEEQNKYTAQKTLFALTDRDLLGIDISRAGINRTYENIFYEVPEHPRPQMMFETMMCSYFLNDGKVYSIFNMSDNSGKFGLPANIGKLKEIFRQGIRDVEQWGGEEPDFIREWKSRLRRMYWEAIVATYNVMRYEHWQRPRTLLRAIGRMPFRDTAFFKTSEGRVWIYNYLLAQEEEGRFRFTLSDYLLKKAKCIPNRSIGEEYLLRELSRRVDNRELLCLSETLECCAPWIKSRKGKILFQEICSKAGEQIKNDTLNGEGCAFIFEDQDGVKVSSETFRGKYIYLDIWATWCGPCKQEMPYMQKLEQQYRGEKIVFVSLSMDRWTEKEKWKLYLAEHRIQGVTLIAPEGFKSSFIRKYGVTGIPRFMLIGPDGKMMAHNCWRPSDPRTELLLKKLLSAKN